VLNSLIKAGTIWAIALWLKPRWKRIGLTSVVFILTLAGHAEFLEYTASTGVSSGVGLSYFIKWSIIVLIFLYLYFFLNADLPRPATKEEKTKIMATTEGVQEKNKEDAFSQIRQKKQLSSKGDSVLRKYMSEKT